MLNLSHESFLTLSSLFLTKTQELMIMAVPPATRLRQLIAEKNIVVAPGVFDGFSARIALDVGFDCIYMVGLP